MILADKNIRMAGIISPFSERTVFKGMSYGLSSAGYDIRIAEDVKLGEHLYDGSCTRFSLASSMEEFTMPEDVLGIVHDKSTWARQGLSVFNTVIEPGWKGFLTLELAYHDEGDILIQKGSPIAQVVFHWLDQPPERIYSGKYQNQKSGPQRALFE